MKVNPLEYARKPLCTAILGSVVAVSYATVVTADTAVNPVANPQPLMLATSCNPCNPCASKCNPCNPCAAKCNPCNPCAAKCNPCNPCSASACNPCNPCAATRGRTVTLSGTLVDTRCYSYNTKYTTNDHDLGSGVISNCASACAKLGIPVALLSGNEMFIITAPAPALAPHMAKQARLTGTEVQRGIVIPKKLEIKTGSGWKKVSTSAMM